MSGDPLQRRCEPARLFDGRRRLGGLTRGRIKQVNRIPSRLGDFRHDRCPPFLSLRIPDRGRESKASHSGPLTGATSPSLPSAAFKCALDSGYLEAVVSYCGTFRLAVLVIVPKRSKHSPNPSLDVGPIFVDRHDC